MKMTWQSSISTIEMQLSTGENLQWLCNLWSRAGPSVNSEVFKAFNNYWEMQPATTRQQFEKVYKEIFDMFDDLGGSIKDINKELKELVAKLFSFYDWPKFRQWCMIHGGMYLQNGIKDTFVEKDKEGLTYFTDDYTDLMCFSIMLKTIMPVWGLYERNFKPTIGRYHVLMACEDLLRIPAIYKLPPYQKLESYVNCFAGERIKNTGFSLKNGVGSEEVPSLLLALALIKKVIIYNVSSTDSSIVTNVYHLLNERCSDINTNRPNQKRSSDDKIENDITVSDQLKIIVRIPNAVIVMLEYYASNPGALAQAVEPKVSLELVNAYVEKISPSLLLNDFHVTLPAAVCKRVLNPRLVKIITHVPTTNVIAASAAVLEVWGFKEISELLVTQPKERDIYELSLSSASNRSFNQLRPDISAELDALYPFKTQSKGSPGHLLIDHTIKEVLKYDWAIKNEKFADLRNSIALLLIKTGEFKHAQSRTDESVLGLHTAPA